MICWLILEEWLSQDLITKKQYNKAIKLLLK